MRRPRSRSARSSSPGFKACSGGSRWAKAWKRSPAARSGTRPSTTMAARPETVRQRIAVANGPQFHLETDLVARPRRPQGIELRLRNDPRRLQGHGFNANRLLPRAGEEPQVVAAERFQRQWCQEAANANPASSSTTDAAVFAASATA